VRSTPAGAEAAARGEGRDGVSTPKYVIDRGWQRTRRRLSEKRREETREAREPL